MFTSAMSTVYAQHIHYLTRKVYSKSFFNTYCLLFQNILKLQKIGHKNRYNSAIP